MRPSVLRAALLGATWLIAGCALPLSGLGASAEGEEAGAGTGLDDGSPGDATGGDEMALGTKPPPNPDGAMVPEASTASRDAGSPPDPCAGAPASCVAVPSGWT